MKNKPSLLILGLALVLGVLIPAHAGTFTFGPLGTIVVTQGGTTAFTISGSSTNDITGYSLYLTSTATGNEFQITSQTLSPNFTYAGVFPALPVSLTSTPSEDLGAFANSDLAANTTYLLSTDTLAVAANTPTGFYTIRTSPNSLFADANLDGDNAPSSSVTIDVVGVPEPSAWALLLAAGAVGLLLARQGVVSAQATARR